MKKILFVIVCAFLSQKIAAQEAPKWVEKAKRAVFSIVTYDKENKLLNTGNGFFIHEDGTALSDFSIFKGAEKAIIINFEGKQMNVKSIMGANEMYDIIKFKVETEKKVPSLTITPTDPLKGATVYLLPYSTKKDRTCSPGKVDEVSPIPGGYHYFTLALPYSEKNISCPVVNEEGKVFGMVQKDGTGEKAQSFAIGVPFAANLTLNALSANDAVLKSIGIKKALPDTEEQALVFLMMTPGNMKPDDYLSLLNDFTEKYPNSSEGYIRRASHYIYNYRDKDHFELAESDLNKAMKLASKKDDVFYNMAKLIYSNQLNKPTFDYKDWNYEKAMKNIEEAIKIDSLPLYIQLQGDIYFALKKYPLAYESYMLVNKSNLASPTTFYSAAKTKELMKADPEEIIVLLDSAIARFPLPLTEEASPYIFERAQQKERKELFRDAVTDYTTYFDLVKGNVNDLFYYYREQAAYKAKNFQLALDDIRKAIELSPQNATYLAELGAVNLRVARYEEAINALEQAIAIDPQFAACYRLVGFCQIQLNQITEACTNFAKAKELGDETVNSLIEKYCK